MRTAGQVLAQHVSSDDENQYLNILLCGGEGPVDGISDIRINDNPISYYKDQSIIVETRLGANDQTAITNFGDVYDDQPLAYELNTDNTWITQQTEGNAVEGLEVTLDFPGGLYYVNDKGNLTNASVTVQLQYRKVGDTAWSDFATAAVTAAKNNAFFRSYRLDHLPAAQYEVRAQCTYKSGTSTRYSTRVYWTQLSSIMYDDFSRPGKVLIGIKALATSQLSGGMPAITWLQTRDTVWVWNAGKGAYEQKAAANPAWAAYDMIHRCRQLKNIHTGDEEFVVQGAPASRAVYQDFVRWAAFCEDFFVKAINSSGHYSQKAASCSVTATDLPVRNVVAEYDEIALQAGTHSNTEFGASLINFSNLGGKFSDYPATKFSEVGGKTVLKLRKLSDGTYPISGTYSCAQIDLGQAVTANITAQFLSTVILKGTGSTVLRPSGAYFGDDLESYLAGCEEFYQESFA